MMPTNDTMRMTDTMIEETSVAGSSQSSITESVTSSEIPILQTSEINGAETSGRPEEVEDLTEIVEIISEEMTPIK